MKNFRIFNIAKTKIISFVDCRPRSQIMKISQGPRLHSTATIWKRRQNNKTSLNKSRGTYQPINKEHSGKVF